VDGKGRVIADQRSVLLRFVARCERLRSTSCRALVPEMVAVAALQKQTVVVHLWVKVANQTSSRTSKRAATSGSVDIRVAQQLQRDGWPACVMLGARNDEIFRRRPAFAVLECCDTFDSDPALRCFCVLAKPRPVLHFGHMESGVYSDAVIRARAMH
jgi:hypothetical protein